MTGGGSGGHITPLLSLARELKAKEPNCQIIYIGFKGDQVDSLRAGNHDFDFMVFINAGKFRRYHGERLWRQLTDFKTIGLNIRDFFRVLKSIGSAYRILARTQPDVIFSKGGFVAVPVGLAGRLRRIPIVTHDSDVIGGLANRIIGRFATVKTSGMPAHGARYVGIPLNASVQLVNSADQEKYKQLIGVPPASRLILLAGGGNGSKRLNDLLLASAPDLLTAYPDIFIAHITGAQHLSEVDHSYHKALPKDQLDRVKVFDYVTNLYEYSGAADLIISRAGATAIAEFATQAKACVIIPSPFLAGGHQLKNAQSLAGKDAAVVLSESLSADELTGVINELLADSSRRAELAANLHALAKPGASQELAKIILKLAEQ